MEELQISSPLTWKEAEVGRILIGKVLSSRTYTRSTMEVILQKAWNMSSGFDVIEVTGNAFMFKFASEEERTRILRGRPWSINGSLLNLLARSNYKPYGEYDFSRCPVWIQLHNVPLEALCLDNAIKIGGHVGEVMMAEDPQYNGKFLRSFLRVRVVLDLRHPTACGFWLPNPDGSRVWISVRYEKLQNFCYNCGKIGHDHRICKVERLMSVVDGKEPRFGPWTTTNVCRSWEEALVIVRNDWDEAEYFRKNRDEAVLRRKAEDKRKKEETTMAEENDLFCIRLNNFPGSESSRELERNQEEKDLCSRDQMSTVKVLNDMSNAMTNGTRRAVVRKEREMNFKETYVMNSGSVCSPDDNHEIERMSASKDLNYAAKESLVVQEENSLAMVLYSGKDLNEVIRGFNGLGLKRSAEEDLLPLELKKRKIVVGEHTSPKPDISCYAAKLRKVKEKVRRSSKKGTRQGKENVVVEDWDPDETMKDPEASDAEGGGFVFKAKRGRKKLIIADGASGWPLSATKAT
ncbi:hypothetical protein K1719_012249 [Acacia pycnantha]|nr:hypothetical protein K1719_012249 [Acacia pycnantha]